MTTPAVGSSAPDFKLPSTSGSEVTLSQFRGEKPVLIAFFPLAFSTTCTAELCSMSDNFDRYATTGVQVLPISIDSKYSLKEYKAKYDMRVDLLSDIKRAASHAYDVFLEDHGYSKRAYFLVDRDGIVRWSHVEEHPGLKRTDDEILAEIAKLS